MPGGERPRPGKKMGRKVVRGNKGKGRMKTVGLVKKKKGKDGQRKKEKSEEKGKGGVLPRPKERPMLNRRDNDKRRVHKSLFRRSLGGVRKSRQEKIS